MAASEYNLLNLFLLLASNENLLRLQLKSISFITHVRSIKPDRFIGLIL